MEFRFSGFQLTPMLKFITRFSLSLSLLYLSYVHSNVSRTMGKRVWDAAPFLMVFDLVGCLINKIFILCFLYLFYHRVFQINFKFDWSVGGDFVFAFFLVDWWNMNKVVVQLCVNFENDLSSREPRSLLVRYSC